MTFVARMFELTRLSVRGMEKVSSTNEGCQLAQSQGVVLECELYLLVEAWYGRDNLLVYLVLRLLLSRAVLAPPSLSYKPVTPRPRDRGNISHDPTRDSSRDPFATHTSRDLSARDPGNLRPRDPGKITHDLSRNWSSTTSPDKTRFGHASNPLINTWQIVGTINKTRPLNNQRTRDATRSTKMRLIRARP